MNFFLHLKESASTKEKQVFPVGDGITSANSLLVEGSKNGKEQFELIRQNGTLILHNQIEGTKLNGEILPKDAKKILELSDEIFFNGHAFVLSNQIDEIKRISSIDNAIITVPSKSDQKNGSFQLEIYNQTSEIKKVPLKLTKSILGWSKKSKIITADTAEIETELVFLEKKWSGIIAHPIAPKIVWINGQLLKSSQKLAAGDVLTFSTKKGSPAVKNIKVSFVEPPPSVSFEGLWFNSEPKEDFSKSVLARSYLQTIEKKAFLVNTSVLKSSENKTQTTKKSSLKTSSIFKISRQKIAQSVVETKPIAKIEQKQIEVKPIEVKKSVVQTKPIEPKRVVEVEVNPIQTKKVVAFEPKPIEAKKNEAIELKKAEEKLIAKVEVKPIEKPKFNPPPIIEKTPKIEPKKAERKRINIGKNVTYVKDEIVLKNLKPIAVATKTNFAKYSKSFGARLGKVWETSNGWAKIAFAKSKSFGAISFEKSKTLASATKTKLVALKAPTKTGLQKLGNISKNTAVSVSAKTVSASKSIGKFSAHNLKLTGNWLFKTSGQTKTKMVDVLQTNLPKLKVKSGQLFSFIGKKIGAGVKTTSNGFSAGAKTLSERVHKAKDISGNKVAESLDALKTQTTKGLSSLKENTAEKIETLKTNTSSGISTLKTNASSKISTVKSQTSSGISTLKDNTALGLDSFKTTTSAKLSTLKTNSANGILIGKENLSAGLTKGREFVSNLSKNETVLRLIKNEFFQLISATTIGSVAVFLILQLLIP